MIPYDDLVAALQNWRARQGLPVERITPTAGSGPTPVATATPGSGPRTAPPAPPRTNPPAPPGRAPMPLAPPDEDVHEHLEVDDAAMLDEQHYENEGDDFAMAFGGGGSGAHEADESSTQIGGAPERPSDMTDPHRGGPNRDDW